MLRTLHKLGVRSLLFVALGGMAGMAHAATAIHPNTTQDGTRSTVLGAAAPATGEDWLARNGTALAAGAVPIDPPVDLAPVVPINPIAAPLPGNPPAMPAPVQIQLTSVRMISDHVLRVQSSRSFGNLVGHVSCSMTINGQWINTPVQNEQSSTGLPDPQPIDVDLIQYGVPRFTSNQRFTVSIQASFDNGQWATDSRPATILLPVVLIPGIDPTNPGAMGGDGTFPSLEAYMISKSFSMLSIMGQSLGEGYYRVGDQNAWYKYPTLYTLSYDRNNSTLATAALNLQTFFTNTVQANTYADAMNIATHSKGGLVARRYVIKPGAAATVHRLIMCQPPNLGSLWALLDGNGLLFNYQNLYPLWNWYRSTPFNSYSNPNGNFELGWLNTVPMPAGPMYSIFWSNNWSTPYTKTAFPPNIGLFSGDSIVPSFSQMGYTVDPNTGFVGIIPAFAGVPIEYMNIPGNHMGYMDQLWVQQSIFWRCFGL